MILTAVGNYPKTPNRPRPQKLRNAIEQFQKGEISIEELRAIEDAVTTEVIQEQIESGLDIVTDGHIRWEDEITYFARGLEGVEITGLVRYFDTNVYYRQPVFKGKVAWKKPVTVSDFQFATKASSKPVKPSLPGPLTLAALSKWEGAYKNLEEATLAAADALAQEAQALQKAGASIVQFDEPFAIIEKGQIGLLQKAMAQVVSGLQVKTQLTTFFGDAVGILPKLLEIPVQVIGLDFISTSGNFSEIKKVQFQKELAAGVVEARNTKMEKTEELREVVDRIAESVPLDRLTINPSCGLDFLPREVAFEKLKNMCAALKQTAFSR